VPHPREAKMTGSWGSLRLGRMTAAERLGAWSFRQLFPEGTVRHAPLPRSVRQGLQDGEKRQHTGESGLRSDGQGGTGSRRRFE
jgi:hypothetical protein